MSRLRFLLPSLLLVAVVALAGCGGDSESAEPADRRGDAESAEPDDRADSGDLECGPNDVGGETVMKHCGPASAEVVVGGETYTFEGGSCERGDRYIAVNVGTQVLAADTGDIGQHYFGFVAGDVSEAFGGGGDESPIPTDPPTPITGDGDYQGDLLVTWVVGEATGALADDRATATFSDGVTAATFSGTAVFDASGEVTGSFDCGE